MRYYHFWYQRPPWGNWSVPYRIRLFPQEGGNQWGAEAIFGWWENIQALLGDMVIHPEQGIDSNSIKVAIGADTLNADFRGRIVETMRNLVKQITPVVDASAGNANEDQA